MNSYLCIEETKEVVPFEGIETEQRKAMYFVLKATNLSEAEAKVKPMGAKIVRVLTKKELDTEGEDGSYDIEL
tara:strand:- start:209 stop:427 length:219 start_codon:yes stop_codon:yes gene_type:complete